MQPGRISIIGVGLLGGSIGLAVKSNALPFHVVGYGHRRSTLDKALEVGAIDEASDDLAAAVSGASLVILCTPVLLFDQILKTIAPALADNTIVTDVGSTKRSVVQQAESALPPHASFVGSHPMAGSEKRGVEYARPDLFQGALCITTPSINTSTTALEQVEQFWRSIGMRITRLSPIDHDRLLADVSHLPHALAAALVNLQDEAALRLAGKGFLDATRIAGGDGALWRDILLDNRDNVRDSIGRLRTQLDHLLAMLDKNDADALANWLNNGSQRREALLKEKLREVNPD